MKAMRQPGVYPSWPHVAFNFDSELQFDLITYLIFPLIFNKFEKLTYRPQLLAYFPVTLVILIT